MVRAALSYSTDQSNGIYKFFFNYLIVYYIHVRRYETNQGSIYWGRQGEASHARLAWTGDLGLTLYLIV